MQRSLILATRNGNKVREIRTAISGSYDVQPCPEGIPEVNETFDTYEGNARLKANTVSRYVDGLVVADDTGIEVDALGGEPGVISARFSGPEQNSRRNCEYLIAKLADVPDEKRTARYRTVAVASFPDGREVVAEGTCEGTIARTLQGDGGFGYDQIFIPVEGDGRTFAEMTSEEKNVISHRARAFRLLVRKLSAIDGGLSASD
jgi:XTP/dITP diphosphohydrolase